MEIAKVSVSGVAATTVEATTIPAGIIGATIAVEYGPEWGNMIKNVSFRGAEDVTVVNVGNVVKLPQEVAAKPNMYIQIGFTGVSGDGTVLIPTLWAYLGTTKPASPVNVEGGSTPPVWAQVAAMIGDLNQLNTPSQDNLVNAINDAAKSGNNNVDLSGYVKSVNGVKPDADGNVEVKVSSDSGQNPAGGGLSATASALLINILKNVSFYNADQTANITALENALFNGGTAPDVPDTPDEPDAPVVTKYTIVSALLHATSNNASATVESGASYAATITAEDGYTLEGATVAVTMGGVDITATSYANGVVTIGSVTGNVIITVNAVSIAVSEILYELPEPTTLDGTADTRIDTGVVLFDTNKAWSIVGDIVMVTPSAVSATATICGSWNTVVNNRLNAGVIAPTNKGTSFNLHNNSKSVGSVVWLGQKAGNTSKFVYAHEAGELTCVGAAYQTNVAGKSESAMNVVVSPSDYGYPQDTAPMLIGAADGTQITVNDFKIYNRVLTDEEISAYLGVD